MRFAIVALAASVGFGAAIEAAQATSYSVTTQVTGQADTGGYDAFMFPTYDGRYGPLGGATVSIVILLNETLHTETLTSPPFQQTFNTRFDFGLYGFTLTAQQNDSTTFTRDPGTQHGVVGLLQTNRTLFGYVPDRLLPVLGQQGNQFSADGFSFMTDGTHFAQNSSIGNQEFLTVTYSDVSLPEPCTIALVGIGTVGLTLVRRRRIAATLSD